MTLPAKLVILDLNGTLVFRSKSNTSISLRPYLKSFVDYLFHPSVATVDSHESGSSGSGIDPVPLQVMVWSSAQPHNVDRMVQRVFRDNTGNLIVVWNRTHCGLTRAQYNAKSPTVKDLTKPWRSLAESHSHSSKTTVLVDDSMSKAILQPNNHICVIEYTKERQRHDLQLIQANPRNAQYDELLLALVGILEEMRSQTDVAQWLSQGGLRRVAVDPVQNEVDVVERFAGMSIGSDSSPWFDDKEVLRFWITRGRQTLERLQIPIRAMTW